MSADPVPLFNARIPAEDEAARLRQEATDSLHRALTAAIDGIRNIPVFLREIFEREAWKRERIFAGGTVQPPISFHKYVHANYPVGLGADFDTLRGFITRDIELLAAYERLVGRQPTVTKPLPVTKGAAVTKPLPVTKRRGRPPIGAQTMTSAERMRRMRARRAGRQT